MYQHHGSSSKLIADSNIVVLYVSVQSRMIKSINVPMQLTLLNLICLALYNAACPVSGSTDISGWHHVVGINTEPS